MMKRFKKHIMALSNKQIKYRLLISFLVIFGVFAFLLSYFISKQQRDLLLEDQRYRAILELDLISEFIAESFLKRNYAQLSQFLNRWGEQRDYIVLLKANLPNGFNLVNYQRSQEAKNFLEMEKQVEFASDKILHLQITMDLFHTEEVIEELNEQLALLFTGIIAALGFILWFTLNRFAINPMRQEIEHQAATLTNVQTENLRMSTELDITRRLQTMLLPSHRELAEIKDLDIACFMQPASEVGGDYYDVLLDPNQKWIKIGIGDVTGHGLESGVLVLMVQMAVRTLLVDGVRDPARFLSILNRAVFDNIQRMDSDKNLTLSLIDYADGKIQISGQHEDVLLIRKGGQLERIDTFDLGFMVGLQPDISHFISKIEFDLNPGDGLVLYTDGITEARNVKKQMYGLNRLCDVVSRHWHCSAQAIQEAILLDLGQHIGKQPVFDDVTLMVIKSREEINSDAVTC
ncbi:PP2C family protein-serine/threonine phosphatase [Thioflexithrix psekupsensis]|nr:PP2C family protein-serine/threonine phosphatase [Thioflexithrix psekupsensis]